MGRVESGFGLQGRPAMRLVGVVLAAALLLGACGSSGQAATTTSSTFVIRASDTLFAPSTTVPSTVPTTTTTAAATSTTAGGESVGDWEAYLAEVLEWVNFAIDHEATLEDGVLRLAEDTYIKVPEEGTVVPLPEVTHPDPAVALRSIFVFEWWTFTHVPSGAWADIYALIPTKAWVDSSNFGDRAGGVWAVFEFQGEPYTFHASRVVDTDDEVVPEEAREALARLPGGSVIVEYESSVGPFIMVTPEDSPGAERNPDITGGTVWEDFDGWERKPRYAIVTPTPTGWRVSWRGRV